jgi:integrase
MNKLVLLTGFYGGMRCCEIVALTWEDIVFSEEGVLVTIRFSKTDRGGIRATKLLLALEKRAVSSLHYFSIYRDLVADRSGRLFRNFSSGNFTRAPIGKNTIATIPQMIAKFLGLTDPKLYTGHSFRVSSATVLADEGASSITLKRHGRWTSDSIAEGYLRDSKQVRASTASLLSGYSGEPITNKSQNESSNPSFVFNNCVFNGIMNLRNVSDKNNEN